MKTCFGKARGSRVFLCVFLCGFRGAFPAGGRAEHTRLACRFEAPAAIRVRGARLPLPCPRSGFEALSLPLALFRLVSLYYTRSRYTSILTFYTLQRVEAPPLRPPWSRRPPLPGSRAWSVSRSRPLPLPFRVRGRWRFEAAGGSRGAGLPLVCVSLPCLSRSACRFEALGLPLSGSRRLPPSGFEAAGGSRGAGSPLVCVSLPCLLAAMIMTREASRLSRRPVSVRSARVAGAYLETRACSLWRAAWLWLSLWLGTGRRFRCCTWRGRWRGGEVGREEGGEGVVIAEG